MAPFRPLAEAHRNTARRWLPIARRNLAATAHRDAMTALARATRSDR